MYIYIHIIYIHTYYIYILHIYPIISHLYPLMMVKSGRYRAVPLPFFVFPRHQVVVRDLCEGFQVLLLGEAAPQARPRGYFMGIWKTRFVCYDIIYIYIYIYLEILFFLNMMYSVGENDTTGIYILCI